jgi:hypothetical protein
MLYVPAGTVGTVRVAVKVPKGPVVTDADGSPRSNAPLLLLSNQTMPETDAAKPEPETVTVVPGEPLVGLRDIAGVTKNVAEASTGPPDGTSARMLYPAAWKGTVGTVRVAVNIPVADAVTETNGSPGSSTPSLSMSNQTTPEAPGMKSVPEIDTLVPGGPLVGLTVIDGINTVNDAEASTGKPNGTSA